MKAKVLLSAIALSAILSACGCCDNYCSRRPCDPCCANATFDQNNCICADCPMGEDPCAEKPEKACPVDDFDPCMERPEGPCCEEDPDPCAGQ